MREWSIGAGRSLSKVQHNRRLGVLNG